MARRIGYEHVALAAAARACAARRAVGRQFKEVMGGGACAAATACRAAC